MRSNTVGSSATTTSVPWGRLPPIQAVSVAGLQTVVPSARMMVPLHGTRWAQRDLRVDDATRDGLLVFELERQGSVPDGQVVVCTGSVAGLEQPENHHGRPRRRCR
jgi:hypothetical protein